MVLGLDMTSRRVPLATVPNAINSPIRPAATTTAAKRTRLQAGDLREFVQGQPPPKKQVIELDNAGGEENLDPRGRHGTTVVIQDKLETFPQRSRSTLPTALERRFAAVREKSSVSTQAAPPQQTRIDKAQKAVDDNIESVRQWRRHYKKQFPQFVIYFESVPDEYRIKALRQIQSLGAREEKFFSKAVTHVITTRQIPTEGVQPSEEVSQRKATLVAGHDQRKPTSLLDANLQRRGVISANDLDPRRVTTTYTADILVKARELGIKIWALEKLQRILKTLLDTDVHDFADTTNHAAATRTINRSAKEADLAQLLRNEKINGPADRDMTVAGQDMNTFRGCYIYVHDMDEATKPVMIRDYAKPQTKEQGKWPQLRLTQPGRCPFIEDHAFTLRLRQHETARNGDEATQKQNAGVRPLNVRRSPRKQASVDVVKPLDPPISLPAKRQSSIEGATSLFGSTQQSLRFPPRLIHGEPVASGLQASNVTSAIRSQVMSSAAISSTAAGMGRRIGDSKEVSALKRKVLERGASATSNHSIPSSYMNEVRGAINGDAEAAAGPPPRAAKRKAQETLGVVHEDDENGAVATKMRKTGMKKKKPVEREAKPGYCENCRDKFDDFEEHINSRKHRKFALTQSNWDELDALLRELQRPVKVSADRKASHQHCDDGDVDYHLLGRDFVDTAM